MTDEQFIDLTYYLDRIATAVESIATANDPHYKGFRGAVDRRAVAKRELIAKRQASMGTSETGDIQPPVTSNVKVRQPQKQDEQEK